MLFVLVPKSAAVHTSPEKETSTSPSSSHSSKISLKVGEASSAKWELINSTTAHLRTRWALHLAWTDVCVFVNSPICQKEWLIRKHGAFEVNHKEIGSVPERPNKRL